MKFVVDEEGKLTDVLAFKNEVEAIIPEGIVSIDKDAFSSCLHLRKIIFPNSIKRIEAYCFYKFDKLEEIELPYGLKDIEDGLFMGCKSLKRLVIPETVQTIGKEAFDGTNIIELIIPESVTYIGENAFPKSFSLSRVVIKCKIKKLEDNIFFWCSNLKDVELPRSIEIIGKGAFHRCGISQLKLGNTIKSIGALAFDKSSICSIELPDSLEEMGSGVFMNCNRLKSVKLPNTINCIQAATFKGCSSLEEVVIPSSAVEIGPRAFMDCSSLRKIDFPNNLKFIRESAFENCKNLWNIEIPENVVEIDDLAFSNCESLEEIRFPNTIKRIGERAFYKCSKLKKIELPNTKISIDSSAFAMCKSLEEIILPSSLKIIPSEMFDGCHNLRKITLPPKLVHIENLAFYNCDSLKITNLPSSLRIIDELALANCSSLEEIEIPKNVEIIHETAFRNTYSIKKIVINDFSQLYKEGVEHKLHEDLNYYYINEQTNQILLLKERDDTLKGYTKIEYENFWSLGKKRPIGEAIILSLTFNHDAFSKLGVLKYALVNMARNINEDNYKEISHNCLNNKEFNNLLKRVCDVELLKTHKLTAQVGDLFKLCYSLGAFSDNQIERQKACEFIKNCFDKGILDIDNIHSIFDSLKFKGYNKEWAEFFMNKNNFKKLIELENENNGFISRIYNSFEDIKEYGRSNRGSQRYRKVTIKMCEEYLSEVAFDGVNETNVDIAHTISKYTRVQSSFDNAAKIRKEYLALKEIGEIREHILEDISGILKNLNEVSNDKFSCEFLSKYDPLNFILGKYCSCCAHLEGQGYGIMKASILHPDCQNLIIRDEKGEIVAKSTLYINRKQGYGLFNNVEISSKVKDDKSKKEIYEKYIAAIALFAEKYNEINKENPLQQINVGMNLNDLAAHISRNHKRSTEIFRGINFSSYGYGSQNYSGDWQDEQYIVWRKK